MIGNQCAVCGVRTLNIQEENPDQVMNMQWQMHPYLFPLNWKSNRKLLKRTSTLL